jgi:hypothetical protein
MAWMLRLPPALIVAPEATLVVTLPSSLPTTAAAPIGEPPSKVLASAGSCAVSEPCDLMSTLPAPLMLAWPLMFTVAVALAAT